jgi:hypothetical protein
MLTLPNRTPRQRLARLRQQLARYVTTPAQPGEMKQLWVTHALERTQVALDRIDQVLSSAEQTLDDVEEVLGTLPAPAHAPFN